MNLSDSGVTVSDAMKTVNARKGKVASALKYLQVHDYLYRDGHAYRKNLSKTFDAAQETERQQRITDMRIQEHRDLLSFLVTNECYMGYIARELDAPDGKDDCRICANCRDGLHVPVGVDQKIAEDATRYLDNRHGTVQPRKRWGNGKSIPKVLRMEEGWCLCADYYSRAGQEVKAGKYRDGAFSSDLVEKSASFLRDRVKNAGIDTVVPVPSLRHSRLVPDFARKLADTLGLEYIEAVRKTDIASEQKTLLNSVQQEGNIRSSTEVADGKAIMGKSVLLVDDMVDSRWTFTVIASELLESGASKVNPFALVRTGSGS